VRDRQRAEFRAFEAIPIFDYDPRYRVRARFEPSGSEGGRLSLELEGRPVTLSASDLEGELLVMFRDATADSGETYPGGRYLDVKRPTGTAETWVDFNFAYSPPCAFTEHVTCPLAPAENELPIAIRAGERALDLHR
jgi:uncharacterized protein (DUF1684 family)